MRGRIVDLYFDVKTGQQELTFKLNKGEDFRAHYDNFKERDLEIEVKRYYPPRSKSANAYLWTLLGEMAKVLHRDGLDLPVVDAYRNYIHDDGVFTIVPLKEEDVERFVSAWEKNGLGWIAEPQYPDEKLNGYREVVCYYGTSMYDREEFSKLLTHVIQDCNDMGIPTKSQLELDSMVEAYFEKHTSN